MRSVVRWSLLFVLVCASGLCIAQSTNSGDIRGTVTDTSGAVIPDVKVTVVNVDTGVTKDFTTNSEGLYDTSSIVAGNYSHGSVRFEIYSAPMCAPFSATERFMSSTMNASPSARTANMRKTSK